jgi:hypothetical protein
MAQLISVIALCDACNVCTRYKAATFRHAGGSVAKAGSPVPDGARGQEEHHHSGAGHYNGSIGCAPLHAILLTLCTMCHAWALLIVVAERGHPLPQMSKCLHAGTALAAAILVPNVEFIFGLLGSTASVVIAYMLPAALFLSLSGRPALLTQLNPDDVATGASVPPIVGFAAWSAVLYAHCM